MKRIPLLLLLAFGACHLSTDKKHITASADIQLLLDRYADLKTDTLLIATPGNLEDASSVYHGKLIDTALLPPEFEPSSDPYYACFKFNLDNNTIGLITRCPDEYASSSIKLFAYHRQDNTITFETELANTWGDAGDFLDKSSILYRTTGKDWMGIIENYVGSEASPADSTTLGFESFDYYHVKWERQRLDTISRDSSALTDIFRKISPVR